MAGDFTKWQEWPFKTMFSWSEGGGGSNNCNRGKKGVKHENAARFKAACGKKVEHDS